jgi:molybdate transport repressor ModE-like protein
MPDQDNGSEAAALRAAAQAKALGASYRSALNNLNNLNIINGIIIVKKTAACKAAGGAISGQPRVYLG